MLTCSWFMRFRIATWSSCHLHCCEEVSQKVRRRIRHCRKTYDIVYDVVTYDWQEQSSHLRYRTKKRNRISYRRFDIRYRIRCDLLYSTYDWQEKSSHLRYDLRCRTLHYIIYDIVGLDTTLYTTSCMIWHSKHRTRCHI